MQEVFKIVSELTQDFDVKRFMLGLSSILIPSDMPPTIQNNYATIMKVLIYLSQKSVELFEKSLQAKEKEEMAEVDEEKGVIYDDEDYQEDVDIESSSEDDEDWDGDDDEYNERDLYDSPLDNFNEIMFFHEKMANLQNTHKELYDYLCSQITNEEGEALQYTLQKTQFFMEQQQTP
jgi:hypothetical protein